MFGISFIIQSCGTSKIDFSQIQNKVFQNDFTFVAQHFDNRKTYSAPSGTGRIMSTSVAVTSSEVIGVIVHPDKLTVNLPVNEKEVDINKSSLEFISYDFTVARSTLENGNILLNFFLNDVKDISIIKMEVQKNGRIDCSVEGPQLKPLLYTGNID